MRSLLIVLLLFLGHFITCAQSEFTTRSYDTEFGRFDLWFHNDQISGSYEIKPKNIIGSIWTIMDGSVASGRWTDPDGTGDIILTFQSGFDQFTADYRSDNQPDLWYRDQWHGTIRKTNKEDAEPCSNLSYQLIQPFLGTWLEFEIDETGTETFIGTLEVNLGAGGCSLLQKFHSPDSTFFYSTQGFVNPASGFWEETYVFSTGRMSKYQWIVDDGDIVQRKVGGSRPLSSIHQLRFTELNHAGYLVIQENSEDGGKTWIKGEKTRVKRKE